MKKFLIYIFFAIVTGASATGQAFSDTLYFNLNGQAIDSLNAEGFYKVVEIDTSSGFQLLVKEYLSDHSLRMKGTFKSLNPDRKNGMFIWYYPDGKHQKECFYVDNKLDSTYKSWYANGQLKQLNRYRNGQMEGSSMTWANDGQLIKIVEYKNGQKHGQFMTFYSNGNPIRIENYKKGQLTQAKCFSRNGNDTAYFRYFTPPSFLGGDISKFTQWVLDKSQYPSQAKSSNEEGEVGVKFTIDKKGNVSRIVFTKRDKYYFNEEVLRVISSSPHWQPAIRDIESIDVTIEIPVKFKLP